MSPDVNHHSTVTRTRDAANDVRALAAAQAALVAALTTQTDIPPGFDSRRVEALARVLERKRRKKGERQATPSSRWQRLERRVRQIFRRLLPR